MARNSARCGEIISPKNVRFDYEAAERAMSSSEQLRRYY
jgi:hypothetical protein